MNPFARVPVLQTPDGAVFETAAILLHLTERHGMLAPAVADADRARFLVWFIFITNQFHPTAMTLLHPERPGGEDVQGAVGDVAHALLKDQLAALENVAASGVWWLSPDRPSIASLYAIMLMRWVKAFPAFARHSTLSADYPALHRMAQGLEQRPTIRRTMAAEGVEDGLPFSDPPCQTTA